MSQVVVLHSVPQAEVAGKVAAAEKLGGSDIKKTDNNDGTFEIEVTFPD